MAESHTDTPPATSPAVSRRRLLSGIALAGGAAALSACSATKTAKPETKPEAAPAPTQVSATTTAPAALGSESATRAARQKQLVDIFETNFGEQMRADPKAWRGKFRKMAAGTFPFYRGSAVVYYTDLAGEAADPYVTREASRVWIQGDLHGENFGTFLDSTGQLVFDVNDFDESYVGPYTWDVRRFTTSMALVGYDQSLADNQIRDLITTFVGSYTGQVKRFATGEDNRNFALTLENTKGPVLDVLRKARGQTRIGMLDNLTEVVDGDRRFIRNDVNSTIDAQTRSALDTTFASYLKTIPQEVRKQDSNYRIKDATSTRGFGIGSAGLRMFSLLLEGPDETLENDVIMSLKQARSSAVAIAVKDQNIKDSFPNQGQRIVVGRRAMQANSDPSMGYAEYDGAGMLVTEVSPFGASPDWKDLKSFDEVKALVTDLGRVVAKIHSSPPRAATKSSSPAPPPRRSWPASTAKSRNSLWPLPIGRRLTPKRPAPITNFSPMHSVTGSSLACNSRASGSSALAGDFGENDARRDCRVERFRPSGHRDRHHGVAVLAHQTG